MDIDEFLETESHEEKGGRKELVEKQAAEFISDASIEGQITKIRELIEAKKYKDAEKIYYAVREQYSTLAKRQEEARRRVHRELMAINKELLDHLNTIKDDMSKKSLIINDLLMKAREYMQQGNTDKANQLYLEVREIFKQIPDAFMEQRMLMENQILTFYSQLVTEFNKKNYGKLLEKRDEIVRHIEIATNDIHLNNADHAKKEYTEVSRLYTELPEGFLYEKTLIYKRILALYQLIEEGVVTEDIQKPAALPLAQIAPMEVPVKEKPAVKQPEANPDKKSFFQFMNKQPAVKTEKKSEKRVMDAPPLPI